MSADRPAPTPTFDVLTLRVRLDELTVDGLHRLLVEFRDTIRHVVAGSDDRYFLVVGPKSAHQAIRLDIDQPKASEEGWYLKPGTVQITLSDVRQAVLRLVGDREVEGVLEHSAVIGEDTREIRFADNKEVKPLKRLLAVPLRGLNPEGLGAFEAGEIEDWEEI